MESVRDLNMDTDDMQVVLSAISSMSKRIKLKSTNKHEDYGTGKRFEYGGGRYAGGAVRYQRSKQEN